jgi:hypothetical protein
LCLGGDQLLLHLLSDYSLAWLSCLLVRLLLHVLSRLRRLYERRLLQGACLGRVSPVHLHQLLSVRVLLLASHNLVVRLRHLHH